ncbi:hypothetical protein O7602_30040 [Micromonospora sp. WMMD1128]|uniref:hypothetical protein n=1 Tax=Micromonospora sp. WMMD1128 TaxID=3015150 RepID=UPI00248B1051|nr:hypothetical protein [Micromonospora sp. WMMD1128]WBB73840.1 hypothetical protein O7602_30040 [Micromonospora sp. WMMD1128]
MQEQPPSDPPAAKARRSRSPRPTFSPPPAPEPTPTDATGDVPPRKRARRAAPTVLFQPPAPPPDDAPALDGPPAPRPRPAAETSTTDPGTPPGAPPAEPSGSGSSTPADASGTTQPPASADEVTPKRVVRAPAADEAAPKRVVRAPAEKKAAPSARKAARKAAPAPTTPVSPDFAAPTGVEPGAPDAASEGAGSAPRAARARRTTRAAKTSPAKRATKRTPARSAPDPAAGDDQEPEAAAGVSPGPGPEASTGPAVTTEPDAQASTEPATTTEPDAQTSTGSAVATEPVPAPTTPEQDSVALTSAADARTPVEGWRAVGPRLRDHPGFAPELLALAAVDALGPRARSWVEQVRRAYPLADADGVARLATRRFVRMAGTGGALAAGAGVFAPAAELAVVLWTQANLVLHMAAAYGHEPTDPDRAAELLVLTSVHPDEGVARAALAAAREVGEPADGPWGRVAEAAWRLATPVTAQAGGWLGLRLAARLLPGAAVLATVTGGTAAAERVAGRAVGRYRSTGQSQPNQG